MAITGPSTGNRTLQGNSSEGHSSEGHSSEGHSCKEKSGAIARATLRFRAAWRRVSGAARRRCAPPGAQGNPAHRATGRCLGRFGAAGQGKTAGAAPAPVRALIGSSLLGVSLLVSGCGPFLVAIDSKAIEDNPGKRTFYQRLADASIETKAIVNLHAQDERFDTAHLVIQSYNGTVLIAGQVADAALRQVANEVIRDIRDVRRIYNELAVAAPSSAMTRASDKWIASKVKAALLASRRTPGRRTKVVAENGVVYLLGLVTAEEANRIAAEASAVSGVQRVVRLFEVIP